MLQTNREKCANITRVQFVFMGLIYNLRFAQLNVVVRF